MHSQGQVKVMSYPYLKVTYTVHKLQDQVAGSAAIAHSKSITFRGDQVKAEAFGSARLPGLSLGILSAFCLQGTFLDGSRSFYCQPCEPDLKQHNCYNFLTYFGMNSNSTEQHK